MIMVTERAARVLSNKVTCSGFSTLLFLLLLGSSSLQAAESFSAPNPKNLALSVNERTVRRRATPMPPLPEERPTESSPLKTKSKSPFLLQQFPLFKIVGAFALATSLTVGCVETAGMFALYKDAYKTVDWKSPEYQDMFGLKSWGAHDETLPIEAMSDSQREALKLVKENDLLIEQHFQENVQTTYNNYTALVLHKTVSAKNELQPQHSFLRRALIELTFAEDIVKHFSDFRAKISTEIFLSEVPEEARPFLDKDNYEKLSSLEVGICFFIFLCKNGGAGPFVEGAIGGIVFGLSAGLSMRVLCCACCPGVEECYRAIGAANNQLCGLIHCRVCKHIAVDIDKCCIAFLNCYKCGCLCPKEIDNDSYYKEDVCSCCPEVCSCTIAPVADKLMPTRADCCCCCRKVTEKDLKVRRDRLKDEEEESVLAQQRSVQDAKNIVKEGEKLAEMEKQLEMTPTTK